MNQILKNSHSWSLILGALAKLFKKKDYYLRHVCQSLRLSARNNSAPTGSIFIKFGIWVFL